MTSHPLAAYLVRAQLIHLQAQVGELTERLESTEQALQAARAELAEANTRADMWRCNVTNILAEVQEICNQLDGTQIDPTLSPDALPSLKQAIAASPFVTVGEIAEACGMTAATVTAAAESMLRTALEAAGCVRAKRKASDGVVRWGYITPSALEGDCASLQTGGAA